MSAPDLRAGRVTRYGRPGRAAGVTTPLHHRSPFAVGFLGALGALLAFWLGGLLLSIGSTLVLVVVALFLAVGLNPLVEYFESRGLSRNWSVFGEPGGGFYLGNANGARPAIYAGARFHLAEKIALTARVGYPAMSLGASFAF